MQTIIGGLFALTLPRFRSREGEEIRPASSLDGCSFFLLPIVVREQPQIDGFSQRFIPRIGWVSMVSAVVARKYPRRGIRIAQYPIEIDDSVVLSAGADPGIDRLPFSFVLEREDRKRSSRYKETFNRCEGASVDSFALLHALAR